MISRRTIVNLIAFLGAFVLLVVLGATQLVFGPRGGRTVVAYFADAAGLSPRNDVTMRGAPVGGVAAVSLTPNGEARVVVRLDPGVAVTRGTRALIMRRSPIGDLTLDLTPGKGPELPNGGTIPVTDTTGPPDPEKTITELAAVLHAVPSQDISSLVSTLAQALRGRGQDLATLNQASAELPTALLRVRNQLASLIATSPKVNDVLAANAGALADDITQTALLADILRDRRYDLVDLSKNGARFAQVANSILSSQKPDLSCLVYDLGQLNATLAQPANLRNLESTLDLNHYFFDGVWQAVQVGGGDGLTWFRVKLLPAQQPMGREYARQRPPPNLYPGTACRSRYGAGVGPVTQRGAVFVAAGSQIFAGR